jgi:hypothetical protein
MASTLHLENGGSLTVAAGPTLDDEPESPRLLRLETYGLNMNGGTLLFLDAEARTWLKAKLDKWDR